MLAGSRTSSGSPRPPSSRATAIRRSSRMAACGSLGHGAASSWALPVHAAHPHPSPTPTPTPRPTPTPTPRPTPTPTPVPTPTPTPPPTPQPTPPPTPPPTSAPTSPGVAVAGAAGAGRLPLAGAPPAEGSAQAVALAPTVQGANAADTGSPPDTQSLFLLMTLVLLGVPALLVMTLLATVLTRR